jgi:DNA anti-recombination protein RmuC
MTDEDMKKKMEFIIEQQAQFTVNMDLLREAQQRTEARVADIATAQAQATRMQAHVNEVIATLAEAQQRTEERVQTLVESQTRTDQKMAETDERLNTLINVVERHISEGHGGQSKN